MHSTKDERLAHLKSCTLFQGLSDKQLKTIAEELSEISAAKGEYVIRENEVSDNIYIIKSGTVSVSKLDHESNQSMHLGYLGAGEVIGDMTLFDNAPRSASVMAVEPTDLFVLSNAILNHLQKEGFFASKFLRNDSILLAITRNAAKGLSQRMRNSNLTVVASLKKELAQAKASQAMSLLIITTLVLFSVYVFLVQAMTYIKSEVFSTSFISAPLLILFMVPLLYTVKHSGYPLQMYGVTTRHWKRAIKESLYYTLPLLIAIVLYKWLLLKFAVSFSGRHLFDLQANLVESHVITAASPVPVYMKIFPIILYIIFVPVQEFLVRGILQSSFQKMLVGRHHIFWAIIVSNLLFSVSHVYISIKLGLVVFVPGLFWGWLYARQRNLIGVSLSHLLIGIWGFYIVGIK